MWGLKSAACASNRYDEDSADEAPYAAQASAEEGEQEPNTNDGEEPVSAAGGSEQLPPPGTGHSSDSESDLEADLLLHQLKNKGKKRKQKVGQKSSWSGVDLSDLADVVCSSDRYKRYIIFQNTKNKRNSSVYGEVVEEMKKRAAERGENWSKNVDQTRNKFKAMIALCKKKALARITESGIADEISNNGEWFKTLFPLIQSRASADPDNAREPSYDDATKQKEADDEHQQQTSSGASFVPSKKKSKKAKKEELLADAIKSFQNEAERGGTKELVEFLEREGKETREHELRMQEMHLQHQKQMFTLMMSMRANNGQSNMSNNNMNMTWPNQYYHN